MYSIDDCNSGRQSKLMKRLVVGISKPSIAQPTRPTSNIGPTDPLGNPEFVGFYDSYRKLENTWPG